MHEINSWKDLRSRLAPNDRQCFAFFHPLVPEDPLIFVEVAFTKEIPESIENIINIDREELNLEEINTAVFTLYLTVKMVFLEFHLEIFNQESGS